MKRNKVLALVLVVAIMLAGAGYALWTEEIITDTSISTGELKIDIVEGSLKAEFDKGLRLTQPGFIGPLEDKINAEINKDGVDFVLSNLYPGSSATTSYRIENKGTMAGFILKGIATYSGDTNGEFYDAVVVDYKINVKEKDSNEFKPLYEGSDSLDDFKVKLFTDGGPIVGLHIGVDEEFEIITTFSIPLNSLKNDEGENETLNVNLKLNFVQANGFYGRVLRNNIIEY